MRATDERRSARAESARLQSGQSFFPGDKISVSGRLHDEKNKQVFYKVAGGDGWVCKFDANGKQLLTDMQEAGGTAVSTKFLHL
jgi:hypothetical protein